MAYMSSYFEEQVHKFRLRSQQVEQELSDNKKINLPILELTASLARVEVNIARGEEDRKTRVLTAVHNIVQNIRNETKLPPFCEFKMHDFFLRFDSHGVSQPLDRFFETLQALLDREIESYALARENMKTFDDLVSVDIGEQKEWENLGKERDTALQNVVDLLRIQEEGLKTWRNEVEHSAASVSHVQDNSATQKIESFPMEREDSLLPSIDEFIKYNMANEPVLSQLAAQGQERSETLKGALEQTSAKLQKLLEEVHIRWCYYHGAAYRRRAEAELVVVSLNLLVDPRKEFKKKFRQARNAKAECEDDSDCDEDDLQFQKLSQSCDKWGKKWAKIERQKDGLLRRLRILAEESQHLDDAKEAGTIDKEQHGKQYTFLFPEILAFAIRKMGSQKRSKAGVPPVVKMLRRHGLLAEGRSMEDYTIGCESDMPPALYAGTHCKSNVKGARLKGAKDEWKILKTIPVSEIWRIYRSVIHANRLIHPGIVPIECVFVDKTDVVLQSRFYGGGDMRHWCDGKSHKEKLVAFSKLVDALAFLHSEHLVHRDIKPENIVLDDDNADAHPAFCDFDISKDFRDTMTTQGVVGTCLYMPPEAGSTFQRDVFSLGVTMVDIMCCNGDIAKVPIVQESGRFDVKRGLELVQNHDDGGLIHRIHDLLSRMLHPDPKVRPDARGVSHDIKRVIESLDTRECSVCSDEVHVSQVLVCSSTPSECLCNDCFDRYVRNTTLSLKEPCVRCFQSKVKVSKCNCEPYTHQCIASRVSPNTYSEYQNQWRNLIETEVATELNAAHEQEKKKIMEKSYEELQLLAKRKELEDLLVLRCPKCRIAFVDYNGCAALTCSCGAHFCAFCQVDCGADAHQHVANCRLNPSGGVFISHSNWKKVIDEQNRVKFMRLWKSYKPEEQTRLLQDKSVQKQFQDLKLEFPPGSRPFSAQIAQLHGMGIRDEEAAIAALVEAGSGSASWVMVA